MKCKVCGAEAAVSLKSHNAAFCEDHFLVFFRRQLEKGIKKYQLFEPDDRILVALSGGKDSLSLMLELSEMDYKVSGLFIDLAIPDSSIEAREIVSGFCKSHGMNLIVIDLAKEGLAIPDVRKKLRRPVCSVCGRIKRHYFNRAAIENGFDVLATGHNLDDECARLYSNTLRWEKSHLASQGPVLEKSASFARKVKPLWRLSEFETACYAFIKGIPHHVSTCPYSEGASFTSLKKLMQQLENLMPGQKLSFYSKFLEQGRQFFLSPEEKKNLLTCVQCGYPTTGDNICGVCRIKNLLATK